MKEGFLGGTFDPPHLGHLSLAQEALERFSLDVVFFVPSRVPPHKNTAEVTDFVHRAEMLSLAVKGNPYFEAADLESREGPSYTVDMLRRVAARGTIPYFIIGMDGLTEISTWKHPETIFELATVLVGNRPGFDSSTVPVEYTEKVSIFNFPGVWVSSSDIRLRVATGRSIRYLVPEAVGSYIRNRGLYGAEKGH